MTHEEFRKEMLTLAASNVARSQYHKRRLHRIACFSLVASIVGSCYATFDMMTTARALPCAGNFCAAALNLFIGLGIRRTGYRAERDFMRLRQENLDGIRKHEEDAP